MPLQKHGNYDHKKHLPDNRMQPNDSGLNVWLQEQIIERLGSSLAQSLIQEAAPHKEKCYAWLLDRMKERGHTDLAEEYHKRRLAIEAQRSYRDKERQLRQWQQRLAETQEHQYATYNRKQIVKCEKYLEGRKEGMIKIYCDHCNEEITRYVRPFEITRFKHHFCNKRCYNAYFRSVGHFKATSDASEQ